MVTICPLSVDGEQTLRALHCGMVRGSPFGNEFERVLGHGEKEGEELSGDAAHAVVGLFVVNGALERLCADPGEVHSAVSGVAVKLSGGAVFFSVRYCAVVSII